jgi:hypothetical protein
MFACVVATRITTLIPANTCSAGVRVETSIQVDVITHQAVLSSMDTFLQSTGLIEVQIDNKAPVRMSRD